MNRPTVDDRKTGGVELKTLYIERSSGHGRDGDWVEKLDLEGVDRIVVGTGPGSFAGIRSAIAFAQGFALGRRCEVLGLPSPCAVAAQIMGTVPVQEGTVPMKLAVVGDARCGKIWIALFNGFKLEEDVFQVDSGKIGDVLNSPERSGYDIVTTDEVRIGELLKKTFGARYLGGQSPTVEGLRHFAEACPSLLRPEPLPIYLNPAVRT